MALYPDPATAIYQAAVAANPGTTLNPSDYTLGTPAPYTDPSGLTNTAITITAATGSSAYQGSVTVNYTRLDLSTLLEFIPQPVMANGLNTIQDVANWLNARFGLNFVAADFAAQSITPLETTPSAVYTLTAQANSLGWVGTVGIQFALGAFDLNANTPNKVLNGMPYTNGNQNLLPAEMYSYWRDFSSQAPQLAAVNLGAAQADLDAVAVILATVTGDAWTATATGRFSLMGATITYNGLTSTNPLTNPHYADCLTVVLGTGQGQGYAGTLLLHYTANASS